jgi:hypothetical protein
LERAVESKHFQIHKGQNFAGNNPVFKIGKAEACLLPVHGKSMILYKLNNLSDTGKPSPQVFIFF